MGNITALKVATGKLCLLDAYREVIAEGYNAGRTFNRSSVQVMIGFLASAVVALRILGDEDWAERFQAAGERLQVDWRTYVEVVPDLCAEIDRR